MVAFLPAFEQVRGCTPALEETERNPVRAEIKKAHEEMEARRLLARTLKSKPNQKQDMNFKIDDKVLCLLPGVKRSRGQWVEETVTEEPTERSVVIGKGKHKKVIAPEDVRTIPKSSLAKIVVCADKKCSFRPAGKLFLEAGVQESH